MKKYQFRLERLLAIRKYREQQWELKLATASGECVRLTNELKDLDAAWRNTLATRYAASRGDMNYLAASELYMRRIDAEKAADRRALVEKERVRDAVRRDYLTASRERRVLDRLKERRSLAYRREQIVDEAKLLDDIGSSAAARGVISK